ncbi:MAG: hypothetical protein EOO41_04895, partial [Methanobacteriota archaeon]
MGSFQHMGRRQAQEDRIFVSPSVATDDTFMFAAVFDGHGGYEAADYLKRHLATRFSEAVAAECAYYDRSAGMQALAATTVSPRLQDTTSPLNPSEWRSGDLHGAPLFQAAIHSPD